MDTFDGDSALPASARRLLFGSGAPTPWSPLEGRDREVWGPVSPTAQPGVLDSNVLVIMAALVCALICAVGLFSMLRCALRCSRRMAFDSPQAVAVRRSNTGLKKAAINALPVVRYCEELRLPEAGTDCPICLAEFVEGERLRMLPQCNHCFHIECIDRWFRSHSSCPTCRHCLLGAKGKKATAADSSRPRQTCESSEAQSLRSADTIPVPDHVAPSSWPGDKSGESFKGDRSGMGCWNSGKASCDVECGIDR